MELQNALVEIAVRQVESVTDKSVRETELEREKKEGVSGRSRDPRPSWWRLAVAPDPHRKGKGEYTVV